MAAIAIKDLFLCHSSVDKPWVEELAEDVENEEWDGRALTVFLNEWDIQRGDNIIVELHKVPGRLAASSW